MENKINKMNSNKEIGKYSQGELHIQPAGERKSLPEKINRSYYLDNRGSVKRIVPKETRGTFGEARDNLNKTDFKFWSVVESSENKPKGKTSIVLDTDYLTEVVEVEDEGTVEQEEYKKPTIKYSSPNAPSVRDDEDGFITGECAEYLDVVSFAENFVDGIIGQAKATARQESLSSSQEVIETLDKTSSDGFSIVVDAEPKFSGWPSIQKFTVEHGAMKINEYLSSFNTEEEWLYAIYYLGSTVEDCATLHTYEVIWSLPTARYPICQATASIYFTIEVSKVLPPYCAVNVTYNLEGFRMKHNPEKTNFDEKWLLYILDSKIGLFQKVYY